MLQRILDKTLPTSEIALDDPLTAQYWAYLIPHFLFGLALGWIAWKAMAWLML